MSSQFYAKNNEDKFKDLYNYFYRFITVY